MIKKFIYFLPSIVVMSIIFCLSSLPSTGIGGSLVEQFFIHKTLHVLVYSGLSISFYFALKNTCHSSTRQNLFMSILFTYIYGIGDEIHQYFIPGRGAKFTDTLFDLFGAIIGSFVFRFLQKAFLVKNHLP